MYDSSTPLWLKDYRQPFVKQYNVQCRSGHVHQNNMPAVGFVLARLNESHQLELLLDLRSAAVEHPNTWGFIGGTMNMNEQPLDAAYRESREEFGIDAHDLNILGFQYKHDHGGVRYLTYTYIFAEYKGQAPAPISHESVQSQWFTLDALPDNLMMYVREDLPVLEHTLYTGVYPMLLEAQGIPCQQAQAATSCQQTKAATSCQQTKAATSCQQTKAATSCQQTKATTSCQKTKAATSCQQAQQATPCQQTQAKAEAKASQAKIQALWSKKSVVDSDGDSPMTDVDSGYDSSGSEASDNPSSSSKSSDHDAPYSLGFQEPVGMTHYYINMATKGFVPYPDVSGALQQLGGHMPTTTSNGIMSYPDISKELQQLDIGEFQGTNSLTPEQRAILEAEAKKKASTPKPTAKGAKEAKDAKDKKAEDAKDKKAEDAKEKTPSIFSRFSQFLRWAKPAAKPAAEPAAKPAAKPSTKADAGEQKKRVRFDDDDKTDADEPDSKKAKVETPSPPPPSTPQPSMPTSPAPSSLLPQPSEPAPPMVAPPTTNAIEWDFHVPNLSPPSPTTQAPMQTTAAPFPQTTAMPSPASLPPPSPPIVDNGQEAMYTTMHNPSLTTNMVPTYSPLPHPLPMTAGFSGTPPKANPDQINPLMGGANPLN
ncbi:hypothetical protein F4803DRAFT_467878 [Xylaria telfairii]|nr:hypothetical protein F4803DRAFT_467878 [Xylaria telfairii]